MVAAGPLQLIVILLNTPAVVQAVGSRFDAWRGQHLMLIDSAIVSKDRSAAMTISSVPELPSSQGSMIQALLRPVLDGHDIDRASLARLPQSGFAAQPAGDFGITRDQILEIADLIPRSSQALLLLVEHRWALNLKDAIGAGGSVLASGFVTASTTG